MEDNGNYQILVVDDCQEIVEILSATLKKESYHISSALSGREALEMLDKQHYDLVLLDIKMPEMDGLEVCEAIMNDENTREIPVIFLSQIEDAKLIAKGFGLGARDYVRKNANPMELLARIATHLELCRSRKQLCRMNKEFSTLIEELRRANYLRRDCLGMAAHGLRNRLTSIMGHSEILQMEYREDPVLLRKLEIIGDSSTKMLELVTHFLEEAAMESENRVMRKTCTDIGKVAEKVVDGNRSLSDKKNQEIILSCDEKCIVNGDKLILHEIIDNLLNNAIKYSPPEKNIYVKVQKNNSFVNIEVRDEGVGFTEEDKTKLFGKFQTLSAKPTGGESSTGLGLSITRDYVDLHGGNISVQSEPGKGAAFAVSLPGFS